MSGPLIISQSAPNLLNAFPGWKNPTHCQLRATITGSGATVTIDTARTTPGVSIAQNTGGVYNLTFTKCLRAGAFHGNCNPASGLTTGSNYRIPVFNLSAGDANAQAGLVTLSFQKMDETVAAPVDNSQVAIDFWADFG